MIVGGPGGQGLARFTPLFTALGAGAAALLVYTIARKPRRSDPSGDANVRWIIGSLDALNLDNAATMAIALAVTLPLLIWCVPRANAMQLGEDIAQGIGVEAKRARKPSLGCAVLPTAGGGLPVGFYTSFIGVPFFLHLLRRTSR